MDANPIYKAIKFNTGATQVDIIFMLCRKINSSCAFTTDTNGETKKDKAVLHTIKNTSTFILDNSPLFNETPYQICKLSTNTTPIINAITEII